MFGIGVDDLGKLLGGAASACIIGLLTWAGTKRNKTDAAERPPPPAAMGIVLDGDTAMAILNTAKAIREDLERWRAEDVAQNKLEEAQEQIRALTAQLAAASGITHGNQDGIREDVAELRRMLEAFKVH